MADDRDVTGTIYADGVAMVQLLGPQDRLAEHLGRTRTAFRPEDPVTGDHVGRIESLTGPGESDELLDERVGPGDGIG